mgnify:CR=1 FL=1
MILVVPRSGKFIRVVIHKDWSIILLKSHLLSLFTLAFLQNHPGGRGIQKDRVRRSKKSAAPRFPKWSPTLVLREAVLGLSSLIGREAELSQSYGRTRESTRFHSSF